MTDIEDSRRRTRPVEDSSEDEETDPSKKEPKFRARLHENANNNTTEVGWAWEPLYRVGEVVYIAFHGQSRPTGPYVVVSSDSTTSATTTYEVKKQDTGQKHPTPIPESLLRVLE